MAQDNEKLLILLIFAGRILGTDDFGLFNSALAISVILMVLTNLGLEPLIIRKISVEPEFAIQLMGSILLWKVLLTLIIIAAYIPIINIVWSSSSNMFVIYAMCLAAVIRSFNLTMRAFLQSYERFDLESIMIIFERLSIVFFGLWSLLHGYDIKYLAIIFVVCRIFSFIGYYILVQHYIAPIKIILPLKDTYKFQLEALPVGLAAAIRGLYMQADILLLSILLNEKAVGLFSSSMKIYEGLLVIPLVITNVMYPRISNYYVTNKSRHYDYVARTLKYLLIAAFPVLIFGVMHSNEFILLLYGDEYISASPVLAVLLSSLVFIFLGTAMNVLFRAIGEQKFEMKVMSFGVTAKVILNILLIPIFGIIGSAIAIAISSLFMLIVSYIHLVRLNYNFNVTFLHLGKLVLSTILTIIILRILEISGAYWSIIMTCTLFCFMLFIFKVFDRYELQLISNFIPKKFINKYLNKL